MKFILGKKLEMTQIFQDNGRVVPVTAVLAEPNIVTQVKTEDKDKYSAVQVGFGLNKNIKKPQAGHLKGLIAVKTMKEFRVDSQEAAKLKKLEQDQMTRRLGRELADEVLRKMGIVARG